MWIDGSRFISQTIDAKQRLDLPVRCGLITVTSSCLYGVSCELAWVVVSLLFFWTSLDFCKIEYTPQERAPHWHCWNCHISWQLHPPDGPTPRYPLNKWESFCCQLYPVWHNLSKCHTVYQTFGLESYWRFCRVRRSEAFWKLCPRPSSRNQGHDWNPHGTEGEFEVTAPALWRDQDSVLLRCWLGTEK